MTNRDYGSRDYWDAFYQRHPEPNFDWYGDWEALKPHLLHRIDAVTSDIFRL